MCCLCTNEIYYVIEGRTTVTMNNKGSKTDPQEEMLRKFRVGITHAYVQVINPLEPSRAKAMSNNLYTSKK